MYQEFYGLSEKPFNLTPDPRFLYLSKKHKEAFAHLMYGIQSRSGFVMVSGEIGTGKTTICRSLLKQLDPSIEVALIFNPYLSPEELLKHVNQEFGIETESTSVLDLIADLNVYLLQSASEGKTCVLIIDEAQNLSAEILEQIRLLSNLETEKEKLIQIMLIGQPELAEKLELYELRQLNQRITARYHLEALTEEETLHYVAFRLRVAGGRKMVRFTRKAIREVYKISQGTPRVINAICDRALLIGFTQETREITPKILKAAAQEIHGHGHIKRQRLNLFPMLRTVGIFSIVAVLVLIIILLTSPPPSFLSKDTADTTTNVEPTPGMERPQRHDQKVEATTKPSAIQTIKLHKKKDAAPDATKDDEGVAEKVIEDTPAKIAEEPPIQDTSNLALTPETTEETKTTAAESDPMTTPQKEDATKPDETIIASLPKETTTPPTPIEETPAPKKTFDTIPALNTSLSDLLATWNVKPKKLKVSGTRASDIRDFGLANNLSVATIGSPPQGLYNINLPSLIQITSGTETIWVTWAKSENNNAILSMNDDTTKTISLTDLEKIYTGNAVIFWRDNHTYKSPLRAKEQGEAIWVIQHELVALGLRKKEPNGVFDTKTVEAVKRIQRTCGLDVDGILGSHTRMVITAWLDTQKSPHLWTDDYPQSLPIALRPKDTQTAKVDPTPEITPVKEVPTAAPPTKDSPQPTSNSPEPTKDTKAPKTTEVAPYTPLITPQPEPAKDTVTEPARNLVPLLPVTEDDASKDSPE